QPAGGDKKVFHPQSCFRGGKGHIKSYHPRHNSLSDYKKAAHESSPSSRHECFAYCTVYFCAGKKAYSDGCCSPLYFLHCRLCIPAVAVFTRPEDDQTGSQRRT